MLLDKIRAIFKNGAGQTAWIGPRETCTFTALWRRANALAKHLQRQSTAPVVLYGEKQADMLIGLLACLLCGRAYVPLDTNLPARRRQQCLQLSKATLVLAAVPFDDAACPVWGPTTLAALYRADDGTDVAAPPLADSDIAYIIFTSGSTGIPKAVPITRGNLAHFAAWLGTVPGLGRGAGERVFSPAAYHFDLSLAPLCLLLTQGCTLIDAAPRQTEDLSSLLAMMQRHSCTTIVCTPTFLRRCLQAPAFSQSNFPHLACVFFCGETLPIPLAKLLRQRFPKIHILNAYGPTEATCAVCAVPISEAYLLADSLPIGDVTTAAVQIDIVAAGGAALPPGEWGEIVLRGPSVSPGYLAAQNPAAAFGKNSFATGDIGCIRGGLLYFAGRRDEQFKYKGYRIEAGEIEAAVSRICGAACVAAAVCRKGHIAWIAVAIENHSEIDAQTLRGQLAQYLPAYILPRIVRCYAPFPQTASGKCDRRKVKEMLQNAT